MLVYVLWLVGSLVVAILIRSLFNRSASNRDVNHRTDVLHAAAAGHAREAANFAWVNDVIEWLFCNIKEKEDIHLSFIDALNHSADKVKKNCKVKFVDFKCIPPILTKISFELANQNHFDCVLEMMLNDIWMEAIINGEEYSTKMDDTQIKMRATCTLQSNLLKPTFSVDSPITAKMHVKPKEAEFSVSIEDVERTLRNILSNFSMQINWPFPEIVYQGQPAHRHTFPNAHARSNIINSTTMMGVKANNAQSNMKGDLKAHPTSYRDDSFVDFSRTPELNRTANDEHVLQSKESYLKNSNVPDSIQHQQNDFLLQQNNQQMQINEGQIDFTMNSDALIQQQQQHILDQQNILEKPLPQNGNILTDNQTNNLNNEERKYFTIKVIKANGLMELEAGSPSCCAYCMVCIDNPPQRLNTQVIKQTGNPYWNEEFKAMMTQLTKEIQLYVRDAGINGEDVAIGQSSVMLDEIVRMPSSRQIIPLIGYNRGKSMTSGSVTVEFIFPEEFAIRNAVRASITPNMSEVSRNKQKFPFNKQASTDLISHNLALNASLPRDVSPAANTSKYEIKYNTLQPNYQSTPSIREAGSPKKHESLGDTIRKKFGKLRGKRSQSADRANYRVSQQQMQQQQLQQQQLQQQQKLLQQQLTDQQQNFQNQQSFPSNPIINIANVDKSGSLDDLNRHGRSKSFGSNIKKFFRKGRDQEPVRVASLNIKSNSANEWLNQSPAASVQHDRPKRSTTPVRFNDQVSTSDDETRPIVLS